MFDEKFWLAISFLTFAVIFKKYAWPVIIKGLDGKSKDIAHQILEAKELKEHAEKLLAEAKELHKEAEKYSTKILQEAEHDAKKLVEESQEALRNEIAKMSAGALQRVKNEEERAIRLIKEEVVTKVVTNLESDFRNIEAEKQKGLLDKAMSNI